MDPTLLFLVSILWGAYFIVRSSFRARRNPRFLFPANTSPVLSGRWFDALGFSIDVASCNSSLWLWRPMKSTTLGSVLVLLDVASGRSLRVGAAVKYASDALYGERTMEAADVTVSRELFDDLVRIAMPNPSTQGGNPFRTIPNERRALVHADDEDAPLADFRISLSCSGRAIEDAMLVVGASDLVFQSKGTVVTAVRSNVRATRGQHVGFCTRPTLVVEGLLDQPICIAAPPSRDAGSAEETAAPHYYVCSQDFERLWRVFS